MKIAIHLHLDNNCREVMTFYQSCLGGKLNFMAVGDMPKDARDGMEKMMPGVPDSKIIHASLEADDGSTMLMASDMMDPKSFVKGDNFTVAVLCDSEEQLRSIFAKLSDGGKVTMEPKIMFWGGLYGSCTDKFGTDWMLNCEMGK